MEKLLFQVMKAIVDFILSKKHAQIISVGF
jgi:hypothetical protein